MKKYMSVTIMLGSRNYGFIYYHDAATGLELAHRVSYEDGMKELRKLEKRLHKVATLTINEYDRNLARKEIEGYIDRD